MVKVSLGINKTEIMKDKSKEELMFVLKLLTMCGVALLCALFID